MFIRDGVTFEFHHLGIPTHEVRPGERYSAFFGMFTSDDTSELVRVQWHRFASGSPLHPLVQSMVHPAFKVSDLDRAITGRTVLLAPYEPIDGYRVAIIEDGGIPVEFIETTLSDEEIWGRAASGRKAPLYMSAPPAEPL